MVKRLLATILIATLGTTACAPRVRMSQTPRPVADEPPPAETGSTVDAWRRIAQRMTPGSSVRVQLTDGTRMRAVLLGADDASVVVKRRTRVPEPERRVAYAELELLEIDRNHGIGAGKAAAIGIASGAAAFVTLMLITFALVSD